MAMESVYGRPLVIRIGPRLDKPFVVNTAAGKLVVAMGK